MNIFERARTLPARAELDAERHCAARIIAYTTTQSFIPLEIFEQQIPFVLSSSDCPPDVSRLILVDGVASTGYARAVAEQKMFDLIVNSSSGDDII